jgi:hypothetical protein
MLDHTEIAVSRRSRPSFFAVLAFATTLAATTAVNAAVVCVPNDAIDGSCTGGMGAATVSAGVALASMGGGDTVLVAPGTYVENVSIDRNLALLSTGGRAVTTIQGISGLGALGAIRVTNNTTGVQIGGVGQGFTIVGIDNGSAGLENAAVYFQGNHSNAQVRDNEIVANGDAGLMTEFGGVISGFIIDGNEFSGQTFVGAVPAGYGFGNQFTLPNVPRQLVVIGCGAGCLNTSNTTFTNNVVSGTAGGINDNTGAGGTADDCSTNGAPTTPCQQGNNLVTIDSNGATITGNVFTGTTARFATAFRARGAATTISGNTFDSTGHLAVADALNVLPTAGHIFIQNIGTDLNSVAGANTLDRGVYVNGPVGTIGLSIELAVSAVPSGTTVEALAGTYDEQVSITTSNITLNGNGALIRPSSLVSDTTQGSPCTNGVGTAILMVSGVSGVTLTDVSVDGSLIDPMPVRMIGIYYRNASGAINGGSVTHVRNDPLDGAQNGLGIYVQAKGPTVATVDVDAVTVSGYQKNGITFNGCGCADTVDGVATGTISNSTVTGAGAVPVIAQNGIQVGFGAGPVTVSGNTITGHRYTGDPNNGTGSGILIFSSQNNLIELNDVEGGNNGIVFQGGSFGLCVAGDSRNNVASCNRVADHGAFSHEIGVSADSASNSVNDNSIVGNATGVDGSAIPAGSLDAESNWWGAANGPSDAGGSGATGSGDGVTDNVDYQPFATSLPTCVDCTSNADCTDGVVCNGAETCNTGTGLCQAGSAPDCSGVADQCNAGACTEPLGTCVQDPLPNGTPCSTGIACSIQDICQAGLCTSGGGGDLDLDGICDADEIAGLSIRRVIMRKGTLPNKDSWQTRGELDATTSADFLAAAQADGIEILLYKQSGGGPVVVNSFPFATCTVKAGSARCKDATTRSSIRLTKRSAQEFFRVNARIRQQSVTLPTVGETPLEVSIRTTEGGDTIDRDDEIGGCALKTPTKLFCREAP